MGCILATILGFLTFPDSEYSELKRLFTERHDQPDARSAAFWDVSPTNEVMLSADCNNTLLQLDVSTAGRRGLSDTLALSRKLLSISPQDRLSARASVEVLKDIAIQAVADFAADQDCYQTRTVPRIVAVHRISEEIDTGMYDDHPFRAFMGDSVDLSTDESLGSDAGDTSEPETSASSAYSEDDEEKGVTTSKSWNKEWMQPLLLKGLEPRVLPATQSRFPRFKAGLDSGTRQTPRIAEVPEEEDGE